MAQIKSQTRPANQLSRRQVIVTGTTFAGGMALGFFVPSAPAAAAPVLVDHYWAGDDVDPREVNAWVVINSDGGVTLRCPMAEMGQGTGSGLPMLLAEELECDWKNIKVEFASVNRNIRENNVYRDMMTGGSRGIRGTYEYVQQAGASARERLIAAAAAKWNAPRTECEASHGVVHHAPTKRQLAYADLVADAAKISLPQEPAIKRPADFKLAGTRQPRLDSAIKSNGVAKFGIDTREPGQLYASIMSCPVPGGKLVSLDDSAITGRRGIKQVVKLADAVAVVADNYWRANQALKDLKITWDGGEAANTDSLGFAESYRAALDQPMVTVRNDGDAKAIVSRSSKLVEAVYQTPLLAHATMEPCNATVQLKPDRLDIWMGSQSALGNARMAAELAGLKPEQVYFHQMFLGGGFGRRGSGDELRHAILVAKAGNISQPLQLLWSREQDMRADRFRPQSAIRMKGALSADGKLEAVHIESACGSIQRSGNPKAAADGIDATAVDGIGPSVPYNRVPNWYTGLVLKNTHIPVHYWRSVGGSQNGFYMESFIDELAHAAGKDPLEFRRSLTDRPDSLSVLKKLEEMSNWHSKLPAGQGRGISLVENHGAIGGHVAEVTVDAQGNVRVTRVFAATDAYHVVNPNLVEAQIEGGVIFGLTAMLYGEINVKNGAPQESNFDSYRMVRLKDAPDVKAELALTGGVNEAGKPKWGGVGECSVAPIAAAVANAIFNATGKRIRSLPFKNIKLTELTSL
ncbi:MAG TPA: molybdopterin cofactor-binding domain-containing protein [Rhizomicrobium sp.]|nr:molybdopterin cofactor-binding domain-containing protein [Rhizomicrobium sp.]